MKKKNVQEILKIAGAYIAVCIGSGFATGQEILQYYSAFGFKSLMGGLLCMALLAICGAEILKVGKEEKLQSTSDVFSFFCGKYIGLFFKGFMPILLFSTFVVMVSGAGAAINQYFGVNPAVGRVFLIVIVLGSLYLGFDKVISVIGSLGNLIIIVAVTIGLISIFKNIDGLKTASSFINSVEITKASSSWWLSGILYASLCILVSTPFLMGMGGTVTTKKNCLLGGIAGGAILIIAAMILNLGILANIKEVYTEQIPTLFLANKISAVAASIFVGMLVAGIYTTAVPLLWATCDTFSNEGTVKFKVIALIASVIGYFGGSLPFAKLVNLIYPPAGVAGIVLIIAIFYKSFFKRSNKETCIK